jgi:hypothetical protein
MDLDGPLRAQPSLKVERPPTLWEAETEVEPFLALLGQMIALGLGRGNELGDLTLNVSNVVVEPDQDDEEVEWIPGGEYIAITVRGASAWNDDRWRWPGTDHGTISRRRHGRRCRGGVYAYSRDLAPEGSVTALLPRLVPAT